MEALPPLQARHLPYKLGPVTTRLLEGLQPCSDAHPFNSFLPKEGKGSTARKSMHSLAGTAFTITVVTITVMIITIKILIIITITTTTILMIPTITLCSS